VELSEDREIESTGGFDDFRRRVAEHLDAASSSNFKKLAEGAATPTVAFAAVPQTDKFKLTTSLSQD
jgi:hypothetical protein